MKKVCVTNISKDPFWKMPKSYEELLQKRFANKFDFHFVESTSGLRENLGDCHGIIGMPFSQGAVRKNTNLENVHFWTAQVPLSWQKIANNSSLHLSSSSGVNSSSVAEHGLFLTMKALRGEVGNESLRRDGFLIAQSPKNKTLGILGLGNIGEQYLKLARSLFGRVIACSRSEKNLSQLDQFYSLSQ